MSELRKLTTKWSLDATEYVSGVEKVITKTKQVSATTESGQKVLQKHIKELKGSAKITADQFDVMSAEVKKAEREAKKADKAFNMLNSELVQEQKLLSMTAQEQRIFNAELRLGAGATEAQKREIRELIIANDAMAKSSGKMTGSMRMQRNGFSQMQYQLQDIAVQMQMGTNPFTILGQQGPQIAALFGPGGAVIGSFIAVAAAIGGTAVAAVLDFESATDKLTDAQEDLAESIEETEDGVFGLTEAMSDFYNFSRQAAGISDELVSAETFSAATNAVGVLKEALDDIDDWSFDGKEESLFGELTARTRADTKEMQRAVNALAKEMTQSNLDDFVASVSTLAQEGEFKTKEAREFAKTVSQIIPGVEKYIKMIAAAENKSILPDTDEQRQAAEENKKNQESIAELIAELEHEATTYGMAADAIVEYNAAMKGAGPEQIKAIRDAQAIIRTKKKEEQAVKDLAEAEKQAEKDRVAAAKKRKKEIEDQLKASLDAMEKEAQGKRDLERMKHQIGKDAFDNLAELAEEGSALAKLAFLGQQAMAVNKVMIDTAALQAKYADNPAMTGMIEGQRAASIATILGTTIAGVFHGGGAVPGGDHEQTYLLKGGEYVESRAERREIDKLMARNGSGETQVNLSYNIQTMDNKGVKQVLLENNKTVFAAVQQAMRTQGRTL